MLYAARERSKIVHHAGPNPIKMDPHGGASSSCIVRDHSIKDCQVFGTPGLNTAWDRLNFEQLGNPPKVGDDTGHNRVAAGFGNGIMVQTVAEQSPEPQQRKEELSHESHAAHSKHKQRQH